MRIKYILLKWNWNKMKIKIMIYCTITLFIASTWDKTQSNAVVGQSAGLRLLLVSQRGSDLLIEWVHHKSQQSYTYSVSIVCDYRATEVSLHIPQELRKFSIYRGPALRPAHSILSVSFTFPYTVVLSSSTSVGPCMSLSQFPVAKVQTAEYKQDMADQRS